MSVNSVNNSKALYTNNKGLDTKEAKEKKKEGSTEVDNTTKNNFDTTNFTAPTTVSNRDVVDGKLSTDALNAIYDAQAANDAKMLQTMLGNVVDNTKDGVLGQIGAMEPIYTGFEADATYGVEAVAKNLVDFAKALSGGDPEKLGLLKDAMIKGFEAAVGSDKSKWMDITVKTYDKAMSLFDEWESESAAPAESPVEGETKVEEGI